MLHFNCSKTQITIGLVIWISIILVFYSNINVIVKENKKVAQAQYRPILIKPVGTYVRTTHVIHRHKRVTQLRECLKCLTESELLQMFIVIRRGFP